MAARHIFFWMVIIGCWNQMIYAQNFQPVHSSSRHCFYQSIPLPSPWGAPHNMWGTLIDSINTDLNGDTIFYNYAIHRDTALKRDAELAYSGRCVWFNAPNWDAGKMLISPNSGITYLFRELDTLVIRHTGAVGEEWPMYHYADSTRLIAQVVSIDLFDDVWIVDSVKTIVFNRYDLNSNLVEDPMNGKSVSLYKNNGIRSTFDMYYFPFDTVTLKRVDPNVINANSTYLNRPVPIVGDILTQCSSSSIFPGPFGSSYCVSTIVNSVQQSDFQTFLISATTNASTSNTSLQYNPNPEVVTVTSSSSEVVDYIYSTYLDTIIPFVCLSGAMPLQNGIPYNYKSEQSWTCSLPEVEINECNQLFTDEFSEELQCNVGFIPFECFEGRTTIYAAYVGVIYSRYDTFGSLWEEYTIYEDRIRYMNNTNISCGNWFVVGMNEEISKSVFGIALSPNPTTGMVILTVADGTNFNKMTAEVYGPTGQLIRKGITVGEQSTSIDLSDVSNGMYLIVVSDGKLLLSSKVVKQ